MDNESSALYIIRAGSMFVSPQGQLVYYPSSAKLFTSKAKAMRHFRVNRLRYDRLRKSEGPIMLEEVTIVTIGINEELL